MRISLLLAPLLALAVAACQPTTSVQPVDPRPPQHDTMSLAERDLLKEGDIILRRGNGTVSDFIVNFLKEKYPISHCGLVTNKDGHIHIISCESTSDVDGMIIDPLSTFVLNSLPGTIAVVRPKGTDKQRKAFVAMGWEYLRRGKEFDMRFDLTDTTEFYCAELMDHILQRSYGKNMLPRHCWMASKEMYHMDNFFDTTHFQIIFNHNEAR